VGKVRKKFFASQGYNIAPMQNLLNVRKVHSFFCSSVSPSIGDPDEM